MRKKKKWAGVKYSVKERKNKRQWKIKVETKNRNNK